MKALICALLLISISSGLAQVNPVVAPSEPAGAKEGIARLDANIWDVFQHRRSVRQFKPDSVSQKDILAMIDAARMAPTSGNQQPWKFLVVTDRHKIDAMKDLCIKEAMDRFEKGGNTKETRAQYQEKITIVLGNYFSAPVYIVVLTDNNSKFPDYNHWDGPLAAGYLVLAARALGYGTVFITDVIPEHITKKVLNIPDNYTRVCITPVGVPVQWPATPEKKKLEEFIQYESF